VSRLSARDLCVAPPAEGAGDAGASRPAIRDLSLEVGPGEWLAVTGANGCGKTSLLLALAGLWPARSGSVLLDGAPFGPDARRELAAPVAVILQDPSCQLLQPTVREELAFTALNLGVSVAEVSGRVSRWAGRLDLTVDLDRDPQHLSSGRQQLVLLAAALVSQPTLLLADEPAAHLDPGARATVLGAVRACVGLGMSVVWVTQDAMEQAAADRVLDLGGASPQTGTAAPRPTPDSSVPMLTLLVSPFPGSDGPAVRTPEALEITIGRVGVTAIEGPNAAGKSVLLAAAAGVLELAQVRVVRGAALDPPPIVCSQYPELEIFEDGVADEVSYAAVSRGMPRAEAHARASRLLERLGLPAARFLERRVWGLSGGEKRVISLVSSLAAPASLLVLDEPTAGLDGTRRSALQAVLAEAARERAVLLASQDRGWLDGLACRRHHLAGGAHPAASPSRKTD
jgi:energy-coupling factor transport system ATP-binding protein